MGRERGDGGLRGKEEKDIPAEEKKAIENILKIRNQSSITGMITAQRRTTPSSQSLR